MADEVNPKAGERLEAIESLRTQLAEAKANRTTTVRHESSRKSSRRRPRSGSAFSPSSGGAGAVTTTIAATITATGLTVLNQTLNGEPSFKPVLGGFIVGTFLLMLSFVSTEIAAALALLLLVTSVLTNAVPIMKKVQ